MLISMFKNT